MLLFVAVDDSLSVPGAYGVCTRSVLASLRECEETVAIDVPSARRDRAVSLRARQLGSLLRGRSMLEGTISVRSVMEAVDSAVAQHRPRLVVFNHLRAAAALASKRWRCAVPAVYVAHNFESETARSVAELSSSRLGRAVLGHEARSIGDFERAVVARARAVIAITPEDVTRFHTRLDARADYLPPSLEPQAMPDPPRDSVERSPDEVHLICSFNWSPKRWNARWVINEVMPLVWAQRPEMKLRIVGAGASSVDPKMPRVVVEQNVPDIRPYYSRAGIFLVPDRQVSGLKFKTLQAAFAAGAIVSTPAGVEGTGLVDGTSALVRRTAPEFAEAILRLADSGEMQRRLGEAARATAISDFNAERVAGMYRSFLDSIRTEQESTVN